MKKFIILLLSIISVQNVIAATVEIYPYPIPTKQNKLLFTVYGRADRMVNGKLTKITDHQDFVVIENYETWYAIREQANQYANGWKYDNNCPGSGLIKIKHPCVINGTKKIPQFNPTWGEDAEFVIKSAVLETEAKMMELAYQYQNKKYKNAVLRCHPTVGSSNKLDIDGLQTKGVWEKVQSLRFDNVDEMQDVMNLYSKNASKFEIIPHTITGNVPYAPNTGGFYVKNKLTNTTSKYISTYKKALDQVVSEMLATLKAENINFTIEADQKKK